MTIKEFNNAVCRPAMDEANARFVGRVADLWNDIRMQYLSGEITCADYVAKGQLLQDRLMELCQVKTEES